MCNLSQQQQIQQRIKEAQELWSTLSKRIEAVKRDLSLELDSEKKVVLERRLSDLEKQRDKAETDLRRFDVELQRFAAQDLAKDNVPKRSWFEHMPAILVIASVLFVFLLAANGLRGSQSQLRDYPTNTMFIPITPSSTDMPTGPALTFTLARPILPTVIEEDITIYSCSPISLGESRNGTLSSGEIDRYCVTAENDMRVTFAVQTLSSFNYHLEILYSNGDRIGGIVSSPGMTGGTMNLDFAPEPSVDYIIQIRGQTDKDTGSYAISMSTIE